MYQEEGENKSAIFLANSTPCAVIKNELNLSHTDSRKIVDCIRL